MSATTPANPPRHTVHPVPPLHYPYADTPAPGTWTEVADGVFWVRLPLPFVLDHVNVWLLADGDGYTLVDTGIHVPSVLAIWRDLLAKLDKPLKRIVVTHFHPDHLGCATWLAAQPEAVADLEVWITQGEFFVAHAVHGETAGCGVADMLALYQRHGLDAARLAALQERGNGYRRGVPSLPGRFRRIADGESLRIGRHDWQVIVGTGHAPEHAALHCGGLNLLISGDMLLPRISTNISVVAADPLGDPLQHFLRSLARFMPLPEDCLVLPAHGRPFTGLHERIAVLGAHHRDRLDDVRRACDVPRSAADLLPVLFARELDTHQSMFAMGEAIAHLNHLAETGELLRETDAAGVIRFRNRTPGTAQSV